MNKTNTEQMDASQVFCPNQKCKARGYVGQGNIVSHGKARARYRCKTCGKTFSAQAGTMFEGLRKPKALIVIVVTLTSLWLSDPGNRAGLWPGRTHGGKPGEIEQGTIAKRFIRL